MKKNFIFNAYDSKGREINLRFANVFYGFTEQEALFIQIGLQAGLCQNYENPRVTFREVTEQEKREQ